MGAFSTEKRGEKKMFENLSFDTVVGIFLLVLGIFWMVSFAIGRFLGLIFGRRGGTDDGAGFLFMLALLPILVFLVTLAYWKAQSIAISFEGVGAATEEIQQPKTEPVPEDNSWIDPSDRNPRIKKPKYTDL